MSSSVEITSASFENFDGTRRTPLEAALYDGGENLVCTIALPFGLADLTSIERVEDAPSVMSLMANLAAYGTVGGANSFRRVHPVRRHQEAGAGRNQGRG